MTTITLYHVNASFPRLDKHSYKTNSCYNYTYIKTSLLEAYRLIQRMASSDGSTLIYQGRHLPKHVLNNLYEKDYFHSVPIATWTGTNLPADTKKLIEAEERYYSITAYRIKIKQ